MIIPLAPPGGDLTKCCTSGVSEL